MELITKAIETMGIVDAQHRLFLDEPLPIAEESRVRVIVLVINEVNKKDESITGLSQESSELLTPERRLETAILKYQRGEMSQEKAAELAGLNRRDFLLALARKKHDVFVVDFDDLKEELARG